MLEEFWEVKVHKFQYKNHAASKLYRDMCIVCEDDASSDKIIELADECKARLKEGMCIGTLLGEMRDIWGEEEKGLKLLPAPNYLYWIRSWYNWRREVER